MKNKIIFVLSAGILIASCSVSGNRSEGIYLLLDTSGINSIELKKAKTIINYLLKYLQPNDTLAVASIDNGSFGEKNIIARVTFDQRPSVANNQKRAFQKQVADSVAQITKSTYTDISGGILQAIEYLHLYQLILDQALNDNQQTYPLSYEQYLYLLINLLGSELFL